MKRRSDGQAVALAVFLAAWPPDRLAAWQCPDGAPPPCVAAATPGGDSLTGRYEEGRRLELLGRRAEARRVYGSLIARYNSGGALSAAALTAIGSAAERLSAWEPRYARDALWIYDQAAAADPGDPEPRLRAAALLLARYNGAEAQSAYQDIRRRWPRNARAVLGIAEARKFFGDGDPVATAESSLALDSNLVDARLFLAQRALETDDWSTAAVQSGRALAANPRSREALAVRAALAMLRGDSAMFAAMDRAISADDPRASEHFVASADAAARTRRYADAVRLAERAVARDSQAWRGWALLGVNRLRRGDITGGHAALETALAGDPFDLWTKNTLDLLDTLRRFDEVASPRFRFAMDRRESALLALYAAPLAEEAYDRLAARYGLRPPAPIRVEIYARHADFSVRTVGLAGIGALGACFGPVIAMDSPSARDRGQFNWGSTLWHEIAHTFHLELSDYRVPRWLTEGLAVLEERRARPSWGQEMHPAFLRAWAQGKLPPLSRLNEAFARPPSAEMLGHAYLLASLAAEFFEVTRGEEVTPRLLRAYRDGPDTPTAMARVFGASPDTLDARFAAWMRRRYGPRFANPDSVAAAQPSLARARALAEAGDRAAAVRELRALTSEDESSYEGNVEMANLLDRAGLADDALAALERALYISPLDPALHERLAGHYTRLGRWPELVRERKAVIALNPADRAGAWYRLAQAYVGADEPAEARRAVLRALEVAPGFAEAQDLLLLLSERRP